jgi:hypothetical protein
MPSRGKHPYSDFMTSDGDEIYNFSTLDVIADIKGHYFPLRSIDYKKTMNIGDEYGTGSLDPFALTNKEQGYTGQFSYASFLVNGSPALTTNDKLLLEHLLQAQDDEGRSNYFDIYMMEVPKHNTIQGGGENISAATLAGLGFIEALINCKVTEMTRTYPDKDTIVTQRAFKYMRKVPA